MHKFDYPPAFALCTPPREMEKWIPSC